MSKEKKKTILIVLGVILVVALVCLGVVLIGKKNSNKEVESLKETLNTSLEINAVVNEDKSIELGTIDVKDDMDSVNIWVFSEPVYLGEFKLVKKDTKYYLEGVNEILKDKNLDMGTHRLLLMQNDKSLGYVTIEITEDKSLKSTEVKENEVAKEEETISESKDNTLEKKNDDVTASNNQTSKTDTSSKADSTTSKKEENVKQDNKTQEEKKEETKTEESKQEEPKQEEVKCTPKKFKNKYTYVFEDKTTCVKNGDQLDAWDYFRAHGIPATVYGCEEIVDDCGTVYYGVYYGNTEGEKFYY